MELYERLEKFIDTHLSEFQQTALDIFAHPETSNHEVYACKLLSDIANEYGFEVTVDIAGHPTGFIASYRSKKEGPVIGILCEYDALPVLGHACGHNVYAAISALSAIALKQVMDTIGGEVRLFGTPCEEGGENANAKISYVNAGLFHDVDVALSVHPSFYTRVSPPTLAIDGILIEYIGKPSHSSNAPEKGINALDAAVMFYNGMSMLRQQSCDGLRFTAYFENGGQPGIIPEYASLRIGVAALNREQATKTMEKLEAIAHAGAMATGCKVTITRREKCDDEMILVPLLDERYMQYMDRFHAPNINHHYTGGLGATDVGNVSQVVPTLHSRISISDTPITAHTPEFKAAACSERGLQVIGIAAKALACMGVDLIEQPEYLKAVKKQHQKAVQERRDNA